MQVRMWKNVKVDMQSAIAAAVAVTAITQAATAVVTSVAHGLADGDFVLLSVQGMTELHERIFRVDNKTADTFELEGEDSTDYKDFVSGTFQKLTFGTSITTGTSISPSGGEYEMEDATLIHTDFRAEVPKLPSAIKFGMEHIWDPSDAGLKALQKASQLQQRRAFRFTIAGMLILFYGYVGCTLLPGGQSQGKVTTQSVFSVNSLPTYL